MTWVKSLVVSQTYELEDGTRIIEKPTRTPIYLLLILIIVLVSYSIVSFDLEKIVKNGHQFWKMLLAMFPPNVSYWSEIMSPLMDTIKMSFIGSLLGSVLAVPFAVLASTNIVNHLAVNHLVRIMFSILRTLPTLVTALIATYIWGIGTFAGTIAIFIFTFSYIGKQLYEQIETADMGAFEAMEALGQSKSKAFIAAIMPQLLPIYLSTVLFNFEGNVRYAAILGYVGAGGIGVILNENIGWREYSNVGMILVVLFIAVLLIEQLSRALRRYLT